MKGFDEMQIIFENFGEKMTGEDRVSETKKPSTRGESSFFLTDVQMYIRERIGGYDTHRAPLPWNKGRVCCMVNLVEAFRLLWVAVLPRRFSGASPRYWQRPRVAH